MVLRSKYCRWKSTWTASQKAPRRLTSTTLWLLTKEMNVINSRKHSITKVTIYNLWPYRLGLNPTYSYNTAWYPCIHVCPVMPNHPKGWIGCFDTIPCHSAPAWVPRKAAGGIANGANLEWLMTHLISSHRISSTHTLSSPQYMLYSI